jgi:hypothetical protein
MKNILLLALCVGALNVTTKVRAATASEKERVAAASGTATLSLGSANVRDFGATGDGVTDDTDAIQRCLLQAATPDIFFPPGTYLVSRTLLVPCADTTHNITDLRGERATIRQTDPAADIFYFRRAHRNLIEGLTFVGGRRQIKVWSKNTDTSHIVIRDCVFQDSSGPAIEDWLYCDMTLKNDWSSNVIEPYRIDTDSQGLPRLTPIDETQWPMCLFVSTLMHIHRCSFRGCMQVLNGWADWLFMDECSIETNPEMSGPVIRSGGALAMEKVTGLAHANPAKQQWWITMDPGKQPSGVVGLDLNQVSLQTDGERGWCVVRNEAKFTGGCHVYINADGCEFQSAGSVENCVLNLIEAPNLINVRNCRETSGATVPILGFAKPLDEDYFHFHSVEAFSWVIDENNRHLTGDMPANMRPFADSPLPRRIARRFATKPCEVTLSSMREKLTKSFNIMDFGASGKGNVDDSAAFRKAVAACARDTSLVELVVPYGVYRMDQPVALPPRMIIRGAGHASLLQPRDGTGAIFAADEAQHLLFQNLDFRDSGGAIAITTKAAARSAVLIDNCSFNRIRDGAISCFSGKGNIGEPNKTVLRVSDCTFVLSQVLIHNARLAVVDNAWISSTSTQATGILINKGTLHLKSLCGVPGGGQDLRWVDNYHQFFGDRCRFGGEGGGVPAVVNFAAKGYVLIQGSWLSSHGGNPNRVTSIDCEEIPEVMALRGNQDWPAPAMMVLVRQGAHGSLKGRWFESGNTAPPWYKDERSAAEIGRGHE